MVTRSRVPSPSRSGAAIASNQPVLRLRIRAHGASPARLAGAAIEQLHTAVAGDRRQTSGVGDHDLGAAVVVEIDDPGEIEGDSRRSGQLAVGRADGSRPRARGRS